MLADSRVSLETAQNAIWGAVAGTLGGPAKFPAV
ncbi:hypothetical protein FBY35_0453 [Streptomyces sp. SLBN-118]|nr:hypothetical protein FBY35_0453 [Streptomyces sp. SLBN-118]